MDSNREKLCAIRAQLYDKMKYIIIEETSVGNFDIFIRLGKQCVAIETHNHTKSWNACVNIVYYFSIEGFSS